MGQNLCVRVCRSARHCPVLQPARPGHNGEAAPLSHRDPHHSLALLQVNNAVLRSQCSSLVGSGLWFRIQLRIQLL